MPLRGSQVKQDVRRQQETIFGDEVLEQGFFVAQHLINVVLPGAQAGAIRSLRALRGSQMTGRWMQGAQVVRTPGGSTSRGIWGIPDPVHAAGWPK